MKKLRLKVIFFVIVLISSLLCAPVFANAQSVVSDPVLQTILRLKLGLSAGQEITASQIQGISNIAYSGYSASVNGKISSLDGLQYATGLTLLDITDCNVSSLGPIRDLQSLKTLVVRNNPVDLRKGSANYAIIETLKKRGCNVIYNTPKPSPYLTNIKLSAGKLSPGFTAGTIKYKIVLPESKSYTTITPVKCDSKATIYINGAKRTSYKISVGVGSSKTVKIKVVASDKSYKNYTITVTRPSSNNYLSRIKATKGALYPKFKKTTTSYLLGIDRSVSKVTITPQKANKYAKLLIDGKAANSKTFTVSNGSVRFVTITVIAQSGAQRVYHIMICRPK